jgi:hypothetical protein
MLACGGRLTPITFQRALSLIPGRIDESKARSPRFPGKKIAWRVEQNAVVAAPSQLRTITAPALPRSNQIDAMLFG